MWDIKMGYSKIVHFLFETRKMRPFIWGALCVLGVSRFLKFYNYAKFQWDLQDFRLYKYYFSALKEAVTQNVLPLFVRFESSKEVQDFYGLPAVWNLWGDPMSTLSPDILFLKYMNLNVFLVFHVILLFLIGAVGIYRLSKQLNLSNFVMSILFFVFLYNGHIICRLGVGNPEHAGFFLLPWFFVYITKLTLFDDFSFKSIFKLSCVSLAILLQGSFHIFVWTIFFVAVLAFESRKMFIFVSKYALFVFALTSVRLIPSFVTFPSGKRFIYYGNETYRTFETFLQTLLLSRGLGFEDKTVFPKIWNYWEYNNYIGIIGVAVVIVFGIFVPLAKKQLTRKKLFYFYAPAAFLVLFAVSDYYRFLYNLPGFSSERIPARMAILGVLALGVIGAVELDAYLKRLVQNIQGWTKIVVGFLLVSTFLLYFTSLTQHAWAWSIYNTGKSLDYIPEILVEGALYQEVSDVSRLYVFSVYLGIFVTAVAFVGGIIYLYRTRFVLKTADSIEQKNG